MSCCADSLQLISTMKMGRNYGGHEPRQHDHDQNHQLPSERLVRSGVGLRSDSHPASQNHLRPPVGSLSHRRWQAGRPSRRLLAQTRSAFHGQGGWQRRHPVPVSRHRLQLSRSVHLDAGSRNYQSKRNCSVFPSRSTPSICLGMARRCRPSEPGFDSRHAPNGPP